jgi:hypothetical protein
VNAEQVLDEVEQVGDILEVPEPIRLVDTEKITAISAAITDFFRDKPKNGKRVPWISTSNRKLLPKDLRDIYTSIRRFFSNKVWYAGGPIPEELLYTKNNFHLLNNIALIDALELAYDSIEACQTLARTKYRKDVEVLLTLRILHECERKNIPQDHIGGLILIYFDLCEKVVLL